MCQQMASTHGDIGESKETVGHIINEHDKFTETAKVREEHEGKKEGGKGREEGGGGERKRGRVEGGRGEVGVGHIINEHDKFTETAKVREA